MTDTLGNAEVGIREVPVLPRYFNLIQTGAKTVEVRVAYPSNASLAPGSLIRFTCDKRRCLTRVRRVTRYDSFLALLVSEGVSAVDPTATRADVLDALRAIYSRDKESLGVLAVEIERVDGPS
jgi:ASC-1-like (ASCH) protein